MFVIRRYLFTLNLTITFLRLGYFLNIIHIVAVGELFAIFKAVSKEYYLHCRERGSSYL